jgi:NAD(P)-dependent dehydrogenase (short-subunit alcohol dehydrogenase family)
MTNPGFGTLEDHVALVTGGNAGLGFAMAKALREAGAQVAIWGRNPERNQEAVAALGGEEVAAAWECDIADEAQVEAAFAGAVERFGKVDSCIANAAVGGTPVAYVDLELEEWRSVQRINLDGTFLTTRTALRHMAAGDGGSIILMSSLAAISGRPYGEAYAASKGALDSLVRSLAVEFARAGVRVNGVLPGWFDTKMTEDWLATEAAQQRVLPRVPLRRWGKPEDLGALAVYLVGPGSSYLTGQTILVDGGYSVF